jgi:transcription initiation factor TFIIIB Brf1 subunit/transcription initiation factor TFIIB
MYLEIMEFYKNPHVIPEIKSNSKGLKRGYIAMVVYYSLVLNKNAVSKENIVKYFDNGVIPSELFEADKFIKLIFQNKKKYSFIFETNVYIKDLCGMRQILTESLGQSVVSKIYKVLDQQGLEPGKGRKSPKDIAAAIYFITSVTASKGGVLPEKLKIKNLEVTIEYLASHCKVSAKTISETKKELVEFYKINPDLKKEI